MSKDLQDMTLEELEELAIELEINSEERPFDIKYQRAVESEIKYRRKQLGYIQNSGGTDNG